MIPRLFIALALLVCTLGTASGQTKAVFKNVTTNALTESLVVPSGVTLTINSGGTLANSGTISGISASDITTGSLGLARIAQGGATTNQVLAWNGSAWAPATGGSGGLTVGTSTITSGTSGYLLYNNAGVLGNLATSVGGNGATDSGKISAFNSFGGVSFGSASVEDGPVVSVRVGNGTALGVATDLFGFGVYSELNGTLSQAFHAHVAASSTGDNTGYDADMTGGSGVNYGAVYLMNSNACGLLVSEWTALTNRPRFSVAATGALSWYANGTDFTTGSNKTIFFPTTPSGTNTITIPAATGTMALTSANTFTRLQTITQGTANEGIIASTGYSVTGSSTTTMVDLAGTWNTTGIARGIKLNITDTASNASSAYVDIQRSGTSLFSLQDNSGFTLIKLGTAPEIRCDSSSSITIGGPTANVYLGDSNTFGGNVRIDSGSNLVKLQSGGKLAWSQDTTSYGTTGPTLSSGSGSPEGVVTANVGSVYLRTNGGASTTFYVKESGTGNTGWVAK